MSDSRLQLQSITKTFPGVKALDNVDFEVKTAEIHALMGENGAGKSTLVNVLTGVYPPDEGCITLNGASIHPASPKEAEALGISTVYQEINLIPHLSIAENITLGRQSSHFGFLNWKAIRRRSVRALARLHLDLDVNQELATCSVAIQQMVAIARALDVEAKMLVLDEPTSSLDEKEVAELFIILRRLRDKGMGIIFITHFLDQVYELSDRITVLRNGKLIGQYETADLSRLELIGKMLGKKPQEVEVADKSAVEAKPPAERRTVLSVQGLGRRGSIEPFDLELNEGEVTGLAGLLGSGRTEIARLLFGIDRADQGQVKINDRPAALNSPKAAIDYGFAFCPENRQQEGIIPDLSVAENIILALQTNRGALRRLPRREQKEIVERFIRLLDIKVPDPQTPIRNLSGGNQQKVMLARWLAMDPRVIILDEPTRGIDVGAKAEIEKLVAKMRADGAAVLFISSELEEVVRNCQRAIILRDRRMVGKLAGEEISENSIMRMIASP